MERRTGVYSHYDVGLYRTVFIYGDVYNTICSANLGHTTRCSSVYKVACG